MGLGSEKIAKFKELFPAPQLDVVEEEENTARVELATSKSKAAQSRTVIKRVVDDPLDDLPGECKTHNR